MSINGRVGILSTLTAPLLPLLLRTLYGEGVTNICVILDEKVRSEKDKRIWKERTGGAFDQLGISLYDFSANDLPVYLVKNHNDTDCIQLLKSLDVAVLVNGGTPRKLTSEVLNMPRQGVINVHPGILPKYRGSSCVEWAVINDEKIGNTAHFMAEGYDEGPIIQIDSYHFSQEDDYQSIRVKVYRESIGLMSRTVRHVLESGMSPSDGKLQGPGELFPPITDEKMKLVIRKINNKSYRYMNSI